MKTKAHFCLIILLIVSACATAQVYQKPGIDFTKFKKIAIVRFNCSSDPTIGQEVADNIALEFLRKGYDVVERSQLESIINEEKLRQYGLTDSARFKLHTSGINAIVVGSVTSYKCIPRKAPMIYMGRLYGVVDTNSCTASLSCKMLDTQTSKLVWTANGSHSASAMGMTANKVLQQIINIISQKIPVK